MKLEKITRKLIVSVEQIGHYLTTLLYTHTERWFDPCVWSISRLLWGILQSANLFQPSMTWHETRSTVFPVEPKESRLIRSNCWDLEQATCLCCRSSNSLRLKVELRHMLNLLFPQRYLVFYHSGFPHLWLLFVFFCGNRISTNKNWIELKSKGGPE